MLKKSRLQKPEDTKRQEFPYRQAVGTLMYLMVGTRPDSLQSGTTNFAIIYHATGTSRVLECYSDAYFGGCTKTGRSTSGSVIAYAGRAISWRSQRQAIVATEAEVVAASQAVKDVLRLTRLYQGIVSLKEVPTLQVDNQAAVRLAHNPEYHRRTKNIGIKHFFIREKVMEGKLHVEQVSNERQLADIMTKPLTKPRLLILCQHMRLM
ncbi:hypothetical protein AVEN_215298-1 [Araneus ventricosus]|uniref:Retrovirus-related Pol polyprotein from transposon TNT 1-94 n=1 Tax=Araneus ventricosus TaxID=182803 RepID=A0A4Y2Q0T6_ARAVE|nr:hypothetical protein AVEN_215298-1 [Araneus ventricosus]